MTYACLHVLLLPAYLWIASAFLGALKIALDRKLTREYFYSHLDECVVGGRCPLGDSWIHRSAERVAWKIVAGRPRLVIPVAIVWLAPANVFDYLIDTCWYWTGKLIWFDPGDIADWFKGHLLRR